MSLYATLTDIENTLQEKSNLFITFKKEDRQRVLRLSNTYLKWQNEANEEEDSEHVVYSCMLLNEENNKVENFDFKARLNLNKKQFYAIIFNNDYSFLSKQELKKELEKLKN